MGHKRRRCRKLTSKDIFKAYRDLPSGFLVPPEPPPGFGTVPPKLRSDSPLITGQVLFDDPFHSMLAPPPLLTCDPCYAAWVRVSEASQQRIDACPPQAETPECAAAREAYFEAARAYSYCMDRVYGLRRFQQQNADGKQKRRT
jgi:hypothetical protein